MAVSRYPKTNSRLIRRSVFEQLRQEILSGQLDSGERIIETETARRLNVSRTPVREAFRKLENEGLMTYSRGRGVTVSRLVGDDMEEIYAIREVIEGLTARLAAERITPMEIKSLRRLLQLMDASYQKKQYHIAIRKHTEFNDLIYRAARSPRLYDLASRFHDYTELSQLRSLDLPGRAREIGKEHERIAGALELKDPDIAEEAVRYHVKQARAAYFKSLES